MNQQPLRLSVSFDPETVKRIKALKPRFGLKFTEVVRECVESDLPRLIQRHKNARQRKQERYRDADLDD